MRCHRQQCRAPLEMELDALGRMVYWCRACERRRAGICAHCPRAVDGMKWKAKYCASCRRKANRASARRWEVNTKHFTPAKWAARLEQLRVDARTRRGIASAEEGRARMREGGRKAGKVRAERLSAEQRKAIARKASQTRWDRQRRREGVRGGH